MIKVILVEILAMGGDEFGMHDSKSVAEEEVGEDLDCVADHLKLIPLLK